MTLANQVACEYPGERAEADQPDVLLETLPVLVDRGVRLVLSLAANESEHTHFISLQFHSTVAALVFSHLSSSPWSDCTLN